MTDEEQNKYISKLLKLGIEVNKMIEIKKGSFIFTHDDCGIVERVGIDCIDLNNNVNVYTVKMENITEVY